MESWLRSAAVIQQLCDKIWPIHLGHRLSLALISAAAGPSAMYTIAHAKLRTWTALKPNRGAHICFSIKECPPWRGFCSHQAFRHP